MAMTVYVVMDGDYEGDWIVAAYTSRADAERHAYDCGYHSVEEVDVRTAYIPDEAEIAKHRPNRQTSP